MKKKAPKPADAGEPASPGASRRPLQGEKALHEAKRSENDRGVHKTTAWPLALAAICLIVYASLYPFADWRDQGISPFRFLTAPLPQYWTGFDVGANLLGYAPLGFLLALSALRSRRVSWAVTVAVLAAGLLSLAMETLQSYLPSRIPSNVDLALNTLGAWLGACFAWALEKTGVVDRWSRFRARWFAHDARGALVLLMLWPLALLFPASVPMGLGQVFERLEAALADVLIDTPFLEWMPVRDMELQPLVPAAELLCVALGALIPCLLGYCVIRTFLQRAAFSTAVIAAGIAASALSAALSYGPDHAWAWLDLPVQVGIGFTVLLALVLLPVPRRAAAALALLALTIHLGLLNQAPADPYFAQTLQTWEQGRFIRFHGVVQWLGWLWPYAALLYVLLRLSGREPRP
ncbi:VanZ like family protein [Polaromonas sp. YR568]|nr:VanZ like family protein [Polaromonas sp. YR568]